MNSAKSKTPKSTFLRQNSCFSSTLDFVLGLKEGDQFFMALTDSVSTVQRADEGVWDQSNEPSVIDHFDHVMYGKLYKKEVRFL